MARTGRFELLAPCLEAARVILPNLARGVRNRANSAGWDKSPQPTFSFLLRHFPPVCRYFPQLALRFLDIGNKGRSRIPSPYVNCLPNVCQSMEAANELRPQKRTPYLRYPFNSVLGCAERQ